jgi:hypothetical protein
MTTFKPFRRAGFTTRDRTLGMVGAWTAFALNGAYAICSGLGFLSAKSPAAPISDPFLSIMSLLVVLMAPFLVLTMVAVHAYAAPEHKSYSLAALGFMVLVAGITSIVNFTLFFVARQPEQEAFPWVMSYLPSGWPPLPFALDYFTWDWFFALSMLFAAPVFWGRTLEKGVRILMILSAVLCILGLVLLPISPTQGAVVGTLGWGVAGPIVCMLLANIFTRTSPEPRSSSAV